MPQDEDSIIERRSGNTLKAVLYGHYSQNLINSDKQDIYLLTVDGKAVDKIIQTLVVELKPKETELLQITITARKTKWKRKTKRAVKDTPQARRRTEILQWLCSTWVASYIGEGIGYVFLKHLITKGSTVYQVVLSGDILTDGVWKLSDFDLYDERRKDGTFQPVLVMRDDDLLDLATANDPLILKRQLVAHGFVTEEEFDKYFQTSEKKRDALAKVLPKIKVKFS